MSKGKFQTSLWEKAKLITALICIAFLVYQVWMGVWMMNTNNNLPPEVKHDNFDNISTGTEITGTLTHCDGWFESAIMDDKTHEMLICYPVITNSGHLILFRAPAGSSFSNSMQKLFKEQIESVSYRGKVKGMSSEMILTFKNYMKTHFILEKNNLSDKSSDAILGTLVDATDVDGGFSDQEIFVTFAGASLLVLVIVLLLRKTMVNAIYAIKVGKGEIDNSVYLDKKDYIFENEGFYNGEPENGEFFVNTDHNVRNEGSTDEEAPEELMTHMVSQGNFFYDGGTNEEGNFYVDSENKTVTPYAKPGDTDNFIKRY